ncbi:MAG: hypothetical protein PHD97_08640 [Bacteroidales bacterium]|nr:hypothetical protein [Bacteroidales bacterium]
MIFEIKIEVTDDNIKRLIKLMSENIIINNVPVPEKDFNKNILDEYVPIAELQRFLGVSKKTIGRILEYKNLEHISLGKGKKFVRKESLKKWIEEHRINKAKE